MNALNNNDYLMKYILMTRDEEVRFMSECINGKPHYTDSEIASGLALLAMKMKLK